MIPPFLISWAAKLTFPVIGAAAIVAALVFAHHQAYQSGWDAHETADKLVITKAVERQLAEIQANVVESRAVDQKTIVTLAAENKRQVSIAAALRAHLAAQAATPIQQEIPGEEKPLALLGQSVLDAESVRLLNDARAAATPAGINPGGAVGADAAGSPTAAASGPVSGGEFADNDLEVVRLYKELATRHDGLVNWVNEKLTPRP